MKRQTSISIKGHQWQGGRMAVWLLVLLFWNTALFSNSSANALYNGNISSMVTAIDKLGAPQAMSYQYDQLNRLVASTTHQYKEQQWGANNSYNEQLSYDANGNILTLQRNAPDAVVANTTRNIDNLTYSYYNQQYSNGRNTNRLRRVADAVSASGYETDLRSQTAEDNYRYDATGNLQQDKQEEIATISWTLSGKIAAVERVAGSQKPDLRFEYDALGNRTAKYQTPKHTDGTPNAALCMATFYVRDAQGNIMATYTKQGDAATQLDEQPIYGSSRLGVFRGSAATAGIVRGSRVYEASNHLGNVLLTFSDKKVAQPDGSYKADVTSANLYYTFGMTIPKTEEESKRVKNEEYRFGFNGKEHDKEIANDDYDFGARIYDARIGRWLSLDPLTKKYPWNTPYCFTSNSPIQYKEIDGADYALYINHETKSIVIKATAYTVKGDLAAKETAIEAVTFWNNQSGKFQYVVNDGKQDIAYDIVFELTVMDVDNQKKEKRTDRIPNSVVDRNGKKIDKLTSDNSSNFFSLTDDENYGTRHDNKDEEITTTVLGQTKDGNEILIPRNHSQRNQIGIHELGHLFKGRHHKGVMNSNLDNFKSFIAPNYFKEIINGALKGKNYRAKTVEQTGNAPNNFKNGKTKEK